MAAEELAATDVTLLPAEAAPTLPAGDSAESVWARWALAAAAGAFTELVTYPLDMLTTRLQLQHELGRALVDRGAARPPPPPRPLGLVQMLLLVVRTEGARALYAGAHVAAMRQVFNAGISVGIYHDVRALLLAPGETAADTALWRRALAGAVTGCVAQLVSNPADVVKVRVQADGRLRLAGGRPRYRGPADAVAKIRAAEGLRGFYSALWPSLWRAAIINAAGISAYDHTKQLVLRHDALAATRLGGAGPQLAGSAVCGVVSAVVAAPVNVVRTRLMNDPATYGGSLLDCAVRLVRAEGWPSLYKGFLPTLHRQVLFNVCFWLSLEQAQRALGHRRL